MTRKTTVVMVEDSMKEFFARAHRHAEILDRGEPLAGESVIIFEDPAQLLGMLTTHRRNLLRSLREDGATPITELAARLGRDKRAVSRDVSAMQAHGLVETKYAVDRTKKRNLIVMPAAKKLELKAAI